MVAQATCGSFHVLVLHGATGNYTYEFCLFLDQLGVAYSIQSPLHLKRSFGLTHGKNDKVDASRIAYHAYLYREDIKLSKLASDSVRKLKALIAREKKSCRRDCTL